MTALYRCFRPLIYKLSPERAHHLTLAALARAPAAPAPPADAILAQRVWGLHFAHPVGIAAGFDKDAVAPAQLQGLGFSFVECGTATPRPQAGNPRPRVFRLPGDRAIVNRLGFNNAGLAAACARLKAARRAGKLQGPVGLNVGMNKDSAAATPDYRTGVAAGLAVADYLTINVSSPNTPGLRDLQNAQHLQGLLAELVATRNRHASRVPLLVKISPDLDDDGLAAVAEATLAAGIDGAICTNTTTARPPSLTEPAARESGGLSGQPLFEPATTVLRRFYKLTQGRLPLIGVGGIGDADQAYAKIRAGASLLQLYTGLMYDGPGLAQSLTAGLAARIKAEGFASVAKAVGADHATKR